VNSRRACWGYLSVLAVLVCLDSSSASGPQIRLNRGKDTSTVDVTGLSKASLDGVARWPADDRHWSKVLALYVDRAGKVDPDQPAVLGSYRVEKSVLRFEPRFPLAAGVRYRAVFNPAELPGGAGKPVAVVLALPKIDRKPTAVVTNVYPSGDRLPENHLRFYLHFSAPMGQGDSYRHVKLLDAKGKAIDLPFLELDQELWDPEGTRFTLFLDPGRVKRGLKPREEAGPVLEEGKRYTLVIDRTWKDANGTPLKEGFRKSFTVTAPIEKALDEKTWKVTAPAATSRAPLRITFPRAVDHGMALRVLWVVDAGGKKVPGKAALADKETTWLFTPSAPWRAGRFALVADKRLEDPCGNSIAGPFEVDVLRPVEREVKTETVKVPFEVRR
jgi:hypothetical protein